jgi:hypothetical protein
VVDDAAGEARPPAQKKEKNVMGHQATEAGAAIIAFQQHLREQCSRICPDPEMFRFWQVHEKEKLPYEDFYTAVGDLESSYLQGDRGFGWLDVLKRKLDYTVKVMKLSMHAFAFLAGNRIVFYPTPCNAPLIFTSNNVGTQLDVFHLSCMGWDEVLKIKENIDTFHESAPIPNYKARTLRDLFSWPFKKVFQDIAFLPSHRFERRHPIHSPTFNPFNGLAMAPFVKEVETCRDRTALPMILNWLNYAFCDDTPEFLNLLTRFAQLLRSPEVRPECGFAFVGPFGQGKTKAMEILRELLGHELFLKIDRDHTVSSRFNKSEADKLVLCYDDVPAKELGSNFLNLVTGTQKKVEGKGENETEVDNFARVVVLNNRGDNLPALERKQRRLTIHAVNFEFSTDWTPTAKEKFGEKLHEVFVKGTGVYQFANFLYAFAESPLYDPASINKPLANKATQYWEIQHEIRDKPVSGFLYQLTSRGFLKQSFNMMGQHSRYWPDADEEVSWDEFFTLFVELHAAKKTMLMDEFKKLVCEIAGDLITQGVNGFTMKPLTHWKTAFRTGLDTAAATTPDRRQRVIRELGENTAYTFFKKCPLLDEVDYMTPRSQDYARGGTVATSETREAATLNSMLSGFPITL